MLSVPSVFVVIQAPKHSLMHIAIAEMVAYSTRDYFVTAVRMLADDAFRLGLKERMSHSHMLKHEFSKDNPREFDYVTAIRFLLQRHDGLDDHSIAPITVDELCQKGAYAHNCSFQQK